MQTEFRAILFYSAQITLCQLTATLTSIRAKLLTFAYTHLWVLDSHLHQAPHHSPN